jgi:hypothetical protein
VCRSRGCIPFLRHRLRRILNIGEGFIQLTDRLKRRHELGKVHNPESQFLQWTTCAKAAVSHQPEYGRPTESEPSSRRVCRQKGWLIYGLGRTVDVWLAGHRLPPHPDVETANS